MIDRYEVHLHLAPTADHLRLLKEYREQAQAEAQQEWKVKAGSLLNTPMGEVHVRCFRNDMRAEDISEVAFKVNGTLHKLSVRHTDQDYECSDDHVALRTQGIRNALAAYIADLLVDHIRIIRPQ